MADSRAAAGKVKDDPNIMLGTYQKHTGPILKGLHVPHLKKSEHQNK